jgi:1-deoxy-D-xylulose-5-phosphate reductoisomerase
VIRVAILGSTGSIGLSTLSVLERHPRMFDVVGLAANRSIETLAAQVARYSPRIAVLRDEEALNGSAGELPEAIWMSGPQGVLELAGHPEVDVVVNALVGAAGLEPTLRALESGKRLALANKESLVAGGPLVMAAARRGGGELVPVDSEHSAILQCLHGCDPSSVSRLVLTASGGPFRGRSRESLADVGPAQALQHPTWSMGAKISIDSATLANKALEVIEAHFLYDIPYDRIDVVVHPQSIIHSFVEFVDGSVLAQMGFPTMELPILYALTWPERLPDSELQTFDPVRCSPLTFEPVDHDAFPLFGIGVGAGREGGRAPAVFNAANEIAVSGFLEERIGFHEMAEVVRETLEVMGPGPLGRVEDVVAADREARGVAARAVTARSTARTGKA